MTALMIPARETYPARHEADVLDAWLAGRSPHTLRAYRKDLDQFAAYTGHPGASEAVSAFLSLDAGQAHAMALYYRAHMTDSGLSPATVARRLAALRSVVKCARMLGRIAWTLEVEGPKAKAYRDTRGPGKQGWRSMVREVTRKAREGDAMAIRDLAIVRLLHDNGLRRGEVCALDLDSIDQERGTVAVMGKGRSELEHRTLAEPTIEVLADWLAVRGDEPGPLFHRLDNAGTGRPTRMTGEAVRLIVRKMGGEAGIKAPVRPHGLRHQAITSVLDMNGGDIRAAMKFARHSSPSTTMIYDDNRTDIAGQMARMIAGDS